MMFYIFYVSNSNVANNSRNMLLRSFMATGLITARNKDIS